MSESTRCAPRRPALLLGLMTYVAVAAGTQTLPEQVINTVTYPFVTAANAISNGVNGFIDKWVNADTYKNQNDELRELVSQMYERSADYEELQRENEQLREMLDLSKEHKDFVFSEPCSIIARNANDIYGGFTINQGSFPTSSTPSRPHWRRHRLSLLRILSNPVSCLPAAARAL